MLTILKELWMLLALIVSFFWRTVAAIVKAVWIGLGKLYEFLINSSDASLLACKKAGYDINVSIHTESKK